MRKKMNVWMAIVLLFGMIAPQLLVPLTASAAGNTVVLSQSFEDDQTGGWVKVSWMGDGTIAVTSATASDGSKSLAMTNRAASNSSPFLDLTSYTQAGHTYDLSLKLKVGTGTDSFHIASNVDAASLTNKYPWLVGNKSVNSTDWTPFELKGYKLPDDTKGFKIWVESDSASTTMEDLYIDEVQLTDVTPAAPTDSGAVDQTGIQSTFEDGQGNWGRRNGSGNIEISTADNHTTGGSKSLLTTVSEQYDGPLLNVLGKMSKGYKYNLSAWVKMAPGQSPTVLRLSVQSGDSSYTNVSSNATVTPDNWVQLTGTLTLATTPTVLNAYVETADKLTDAKSFYMDDFDLSYVGQVSGPKPIQTDIDPLKDIYADNFKVGAAVTGDQLTSDVHTLLDYHYSSIVAENATKPGSLEPTEGQWNWTEADSIAQYAKAHNMNFRLHTLAWHSQAAEWMFKDAQGQPLAATPENKQLVLDRLTTYIQTVARHFSSMDVPINAVDVVNEVIDPGQPDGMRKSEWYALTGLDFIRTAFKVARQELPNAKLYINDYSTQDPVKRDFLFNLVTKLKGEGVPIDGVGHQTHINVSGPSIDQISESIRKFGEAGFDNQVTELDVSVYTDSSSTSYDDSILVKQGYRYKQLFQELVRLDNEGKNAASNTQAYNPDGWISNVTLWGIADDHTWLDNQGATRKDAPFPFDVQYQGKYAYWGMIEAVKTLTPSHLPITAQTANTAKGTPANASDPVWNTVPALKTQQLGTLQAEVKTLWDEQYLYARVAVKDITKTATDKIELFVDDNGIKKYTFARNDAQITEDTDGYVLQAVIPLAGGALGKKVKFDVRDTDMGINDGTEHGSNGVIVSWSDPRNTQDNDVLGYGILTYIDAVKAASASYGTPTIDGEMDSKWANSPVYTTDVMVEQHNNAVAKAQLRAMWDEHNLYVYAVVLDSNLSDANANAWEQDSMEIFVDQNNGKTDSYQGDDGQYRINFQNVKTVGGHATPNNYTSATKIIDGGYGVEAAIALDTITPKAGTVIGFDFQVNNDQDGGSRDSVFSWNDPTGQSYQNTSRFGVLKLEQVQTSAPSTSQTSSVSTPEPEGAVKVQTDTGGKVESNGAAVDLPAGAIGSDIYVSIKKLSDTSQLKPDPDLKLAGDVFEITKDVTGTFGKPVIITLPFDKNMLDGQHEVALYWYNEQTGKWVKLDDIKVDREKGIVSGSVMHFTKFAVLAAEKSASVVVPALIDIKGHWAEKGIQALVKAGVIDGYQDGSFRPEAVVTRAEFVSMIVRAFHLTATGGADFADTGSHWAKEAIATTSALGIVDGYEDGTFGPDNNITREQMAVILVRAAHLASANGGLDYKDSDDVSAWSQGPLAALTAKGVLNGYEDGTLRPKAFSTRAEVAIIIIRILEAQKVQ
ncbi:endo-1,4-beta-xylanase [Paenibacillus aceris]|uniref:Beta-xylanase n=1 Tax=Paenibacillus aceris TaxID=869555 RepID=A0ABS4I5E8_9BACL|nr:endo-1,4-beta-xylanase [Paenibacillus aceris]MBP1966130.1 endo-1,4-beta-xylanase [Paenibacillus aceris]NHW33289.1 1,4-beta-xylanase [Paenibacillus aceris]